MAETVLVTKLSDLAEAYDGFIVDLWGVLHDGVTAFPEALDCMHALRARGKKIAILSNAPRRADSVIARNRELGITEQHFDAVLSSGEETWQFLKRRPDDWYRALGARCFHLGPERDKGMLEGLDYGFVESVRQGDFILNTGTHDGSDQLADYQDILDHGLAGGLPMVCANPDREVIRGGRREICAGAIAEHYQVMGARVRFHGKPSGTVYRTCLDLLALGPDARVLAVGDSLRTDVAGARAAGLDSLFVLGGIHAEALGLENGGLGIGALANGSAPSAARLEALFRDFGFAPTASIPSLSW